MQSDTVVKCNIFIVWRPGWCVILNCPSRYVLAPGYRIHKKTDDARPQRDPSLSRLFIHTKQWHSGPPGRAWCQARWGGHEPLWQWNQSASSLKSCFTEVPKQWLRNPAIWRQIWPTKTTGPVKRALVRRALATKSQQFLLGYIMGYLENWRAPKWSKSYRNSKANH